MDTSARYLAFQVPPWSAATGVAFALDAGTTRPRSWIGVALAPSFAKDSDLDRYFRGTDEAHEHEPGSELRGAEGEGVVPLAPERGVQARHERWRGRAAEPCLAIGGATRGCALEGQRVWLVGRPNA